MSFLFTNTEPYSRSFSLTKGGGDTAYILGLQSEDLKRCFVLFFEITNPFQKLLTAKNPHQEKCIFRNMHSQSISGSHPLKSISNQIIKYSIMFKSRIRPLSEKYVNYP